MTTDFDVAIVGSGPAGVSAAFPLVELGVKVLMVDGGRQARISPPEQPFLTARAEDEDQWKWMLGENFYALQKLDAVSPKLRVPTHEYVFEEFEAANHLEAQDFIAVGSLSTGGLSNAWGCGVARLSARELAEFPFHPSDIEFSYETVTRRIGVSGRQDDDLSDYFGLDAWSQPPIQMDALHSHVFERYAKRKERLAPMGFRLGRSRVAAISEDHAGRKACDLSGNCLWGCHRRALYSAGDELPLLRQHRNFRHEFGFVVEAISRIGNSWSLNGLQYRERRSITARRVVLAAGTLATTRLALQALNLTRAVPLHSCPTAAFLLWLPSMLGAPRVPAFGLGQLSFTLDMQDGISGVGSTFVTTGIPVSEFVRHLPLLRRYGIDLLRGLLSSCLAGNLFLPGCLSTATAALGDDGSLRVEGGYSDRVPSLMGDAVRQLRRAYWRLGAVLLPMSFTVGRPGGDIHYAGTLPMRLRPALGETNELGEVCGLEGVHIVDGACLRTLSEKFHTLTIMANADRIGRDLFTKVAPPQNVC